MSLTGTLTRLGLKTFAGVDPPDLFGNPGGLSEIINQIDALFGAVKISDTVLGAPGVVTLTGIPATYRHLLFAWNAGANNVLNQNLQATFNADGGNNYNWILLQTINGAAASAAEGTAGTVMIFGTTGNNAGTGCGLVLIANYTGSFTKRFAALSEADGSDRRIAIHGGGWNNGAAINRVDFTAGGGAFIAGSRFTLWGLV